MRSHRFAWPVAWIVVTAAAGSVMLPEARHVVLAGASILLLGVTAAAALTTAWRARPSAASPFASLLPPAPAPARPDDLVRLERLLGWKVYSRAEFDVRVAPVLAPVVAARVKKRFGVEVAADPERARELVDPDLWALVDPSRQDHEGPNVTTRDIADLVDRIEAV